MKILVASHTYIVDINRQKLRALTALESGIEVTIVVPRRWKPGGIQNKIIETKFIKEDSFQVVPISNFSDNNQGLLTFGADLIGLLWQFRPQIIQVEQGSRSLAYAQLITINKILRLKAKNVFFTWWNLPYNLKPPISWLEAYNLHHTDGIIAGNQEGAEILRQRGYKGLIKVMPQLGVDEELFRPQPQPELREKLGINSNDFIVGFVGRFVEEKGLLTLAKALALLRKHPWKWLLLGRGALQQTLTDWAEREGLTERLIWVESVPHDQVYKYINLMNVLVLPSQTSTKFKTLTAVGWKEQFGHVLIEAMACRVPVIGSDSGEIPNVIKDAGLIFPEGNAEALRDCLMRVMEEPELAKSLAERGRERVIALYTNKALARQLLDFYKQLII
ncbi:MAG: hormogonium polysaccharide biosynthesis glycosyltransferase HpsO [Oscillatoriaceae bacterium SKW80]|nr:hormogonium polysaccharide biosynthesis glycosyltransferase HpsO [Oscillatoriaceae bacterium SKYG93]MCX8121997.1 hormogonium polysaccharide biosynthesis glycosyltransferase HpsO [Oscillatoriaceae bacterium SKW80]MDW8454283.1 hormogonium polysaccharide biosynthesis glycosyltransferase HpsO [Oscillatoriaceae cyanobacterium SKYGB_i_bin93]HIK29147.1 glycosyltransferase family 4 protein [Oscillatoriaceae cyanobacterium M7585_C2015_266]